MFYFYFVFTGSFPLSLAWGNLMRWFLGVYFLSLLSFSLYSYVSYTIWKEFNFCVSVCVFLFCIFLSFCNFEDTNYSLALLFYININLIFPSVLPIGSFLLICFQGLCISPAIFLAFSSILGSSMLLFVLFRSEISMWFSLKSSLPSILRRHTPTSWHFTTVGPVFVR